MQVKVLSIVAILMIAISISATPVKIQGYPFDKTVDKEIGARIETYKYTGTKHNDVFVKLPALFDMPDNLAEVSSEINKKTGVLTKKFYIEKYDGTPGVLEYSINSKKVVTKIIVIFVIDTMSGTYKYDGGDSMMSCIVTLQGETFFGSFWLETALGATGRENFSGMYGEDLILFDEDYGQIGKINDGYISITFPDGRTVRANKL